MDTKRFASNPHNGSIDHTKATFDREAGHLRAPEFRELVTRNLRCLHPPRPEPRQLPNDPAVSALRAFFFADDMPDVPFPVINICHVNTKQGDGDPACRLLSYVDDEASEMVDGIPMVSVPIASVLPAPGSPPKLPPSIFTGLWNFDMFWDKPGVVAFDVMMSWKLDNPDPGIFEVFPLASIMCAVGWRLQPFGGAVLLDIDSALYRHSTKAAPSSANLVRMDKIADSATRGTLEAAGARSVCLDFGSYPLVDNTDPNDAFRLTRTTRFKITVTGGGRAKLRVHRYGVLLNASDPVGEAASRALRGCMRLPIDPVEVEVVKEVEVVVPGPPFVPPENFRLVDAKGELLRLDEHLTVDVLKSSGRFDFEWTNVSPIAGSTLEYEITIEVLAGCVGFQTQTRSFAAGPPGSSQAASWVQTYPLTHVCLWSKYRCRARSVSNGSSTVFSTFTPWQEFTIMHT